MEFFVDQASVVRKIWGKADTVLFIFVGASAEFALNKAVDWLYFTGRLPADPLARLFSTMAYARQIIFSEKEAAYRAIDTIAAIHAGVEGRRGAQIPDWAYRDVLFMLIGYSISAFELLEGKLTAAEKEEVFRVFTRVGLRMGLKQLPGSYPEWQQARAGHLQQNLAYSALSQDLYRQYKKHLGPWRYRLLLEAQKMLVPRLVRELLQLGKISLLAPVLVLYKVSRRLGLEKIIRNVMLPSHLRQQVGQLEVERSP